MRFTRRQGLRGLAVGSLSATVTRASSGRVLDVTSAAAPRSARAQDAASTNQFAMLHGNAARTGVTDQPGPTTQPRILWQTTIEQELFAPIVFGDQLIVCSRSGVVATLDAATGAVVRQAAVSGGISGPAAVSSASIFVPGADGTIRVLNARNGRERWNAFFGGSPSSPALIGDIVVVASSRVSVDGGGGPFNSAIAYNAKSGKKLWQTYAEKDSFVSAVSIANDTVFVVCGRGTTEIFAYSLEDGTSRWAQELFNFSLGSAAVSDDVVYIAYGYRISGSVAALDATTGALIWEAVGRPLPSTTAVVSDDAVYATDLKGILALDRATGTERWRVPSESVNYAGATVSGTTLYSTGGFQDQIIQAIDVTSGDILWKVDFEESVRWPPAVVGEMLIVSSDEGNVTAFG